MKRNQKIGLLSFFVVIVLVSLTTVSCSRVPDVPLGKELVPPGEDRVTQNISSLLIGHLKEQYRDQRTLRDTHPKSNGCIKGTFIIDEDIAEEYQYGVFKKGGRYPVWMRFSNSVEEITDDQEDDFRGLAIKLFNVTGERLPDPGDELHTQDFLFLGHDGFFAANAQEFFDFFSANFNDRAFSFLVTHPQGAINLLIGSKQYSNPLNLVWNSVTPYALGPASDNGTYKNVVRYGVRTCAVNSGEIKGQHAPDYLEENLQEQLKSGEGCLEFMIQPQTDPKAMPVENAVIQWDQDESPFISIAKIEIPSQVFTSDEQKEFCENLSFNPWHGLKIHRPLGGVNRARRIVMKNISDFRLQQNGIIRTEPTGLEQF